MGRPSTGRLGSGAGKVAPGTGGSQRENWPDHPGTGSGSGEESDYDSLRSSAAVRVRRGAWHQTAQGQAEGHDRRAGKEAQEAKEASAAVGHHQLAGSGGRVAFGRDYDREG